MAREPLILGGGQSTVRWSPEISWRCPPWSSSVCPTEGHGLQSQQLQCVAHHMHSCGTL